jgi:hypothetical protein
MGHNELSVLPKSQRWRAVVDMLQSPELNVPAVAGASCLAAERRLIQLRGDPSLTYCFWLLVRLASAARGPEFQTDVQRLGLAARANEPTLQFLARVAERTRIELIAYPASGPFGEMAALALRQTLTETVGTHTRSLFGSTLDDLEDAFRRHSTVGQFGVLAQRFFGHFMGQTLRYYLDRAMPGAVGGPGLGTPRETTDFLNAIDLHAYQTARIVELFAAQWYSKQQFEQMGAIGRDDAQRFVAHALAKLQRELMRERAP